MTTAPALRCLACASPITSLADHCRCEVVIHCPMCRRMEWSERLPEDGDASQVEVVCNLCEEGP
jgi:hypothetical protein